MKQEFELGVIDGDLGVVCQNFDVSLDRVFTRIVVLFGIVCVSGKYAGSCTGKMSGIEGSRETRYFMHLLFGIQN